MSRLYNEEWQRRKSMLIKSLFCDMAVLSPVPEESFESDRYQSYDNGLQSPTKPQYRAYSPLPPLIIEKEPNRHDDPDEYYIKLLNRIKRIYKKLFVENQSLDSEDFNITNSIYEDEVNNYESDVQMNERDIHYDNVSLDSNVTINSNGYVADFESSNESVDNNSDMNVEESNNEQMDEENDFEPSNAENINLESNKQSPNNISNDNEMTEARLNGTTSNDSNSNSQDETANTNINNQELDVTALNKTNEQINEENSTDSSEIDQVMVDQRNVSNKEMDIIVEERYTTRTEMITSENNELSKFDEVMDVCDDEADDTFDAGIDYRQITTVALVHIDGSQQDVGRVSPVYETVTSPILPRGVVIEEEKRDEAVLEEHGDPEQTTSLSTDDNTNEGIEEMRTPRIELSIESNPINRYSSSLGDNSPNIEIATALEIENTNHLLEPNNSNDINDILTSFISDSYKEMSNNRNGRKRKLYEDISVQTVRQVSWDEVRDNFFVGTPKIFRLCRCVDHDCSNSI